MKSLRQRFKQQFTTHPVKTTLLGIVLATAFTISVALLLIGFAIWSDIRSIGTFVDPSPKSAMRAFAQIDFTLPKQADYLLLENGFGLTNSWLYLKFACGDAAYQEFLHANHIGIHEIQETEQCRTLFPFEHPAWDLQENIRCGAYGRQIDTSHPTDDVWMFTMSHVHQGGQHIVYLEAVELYD